IKFNINVLQWGANSGYASFNNDDSEYFNISNTFGSFRLGDSLVISNMSNNTIAAANATVNSTSNTVITGNTSTIAANSKVIITSTNNEIGYLANVVSVTNSTAFIANTKPLSNDTLSSVYVINATPTGTVGDITSNSSFLRISNSSSNSSTYMQNSYSYMVLDTNTGAFTTAGNLHDINFNSLMGKFAP